MGIVALQGKAYDGQNAKKPLSTANMSHPDGIKSHLLYKLLCTALIGTLTLCLQHHCRSSTQAKSDAISCMQAAPCPGKLLPHFPALSDTLCHTFHSFLKVLPAEPVLRSLPTETLQTSRPFEPCRPQTQLKLFRLEGQLNPCIAQGQLTPFTPYLKVEEVIQAHNAVLIRRIRVIDVPQ